jgi:23S rRNA pseudouridine1911/1915/1917 synthase
MVFALTPQAETNLIRQFKRHSIERRYRAIVVGQPQDQRIESRLVRDRGDGLRGSTKDPQEGENAITRIRLVERFREFSMVECQLETGRTHQIRIHLSELGHPVCGDPLYKTVTAAAPPIPTSAPRLALHAFQLVFDHPISGKRMEFTAPFPADLDRFLQNLRGTQIG